MRRTTSVAFASVVGSVALVFGVGSACSSFSGADPSSVSEGGVDDAPAAMADAADAPTACEPSDLAALAMDPENCGRCDHSCLGGACSEGQCQPFPLVEAAPETILDVRVDEQDVLWTTTSGLPWQDPGNIYRCAKTGCATPTALLSAPLPMGSLVTDGVSGASSYVSFVYGSRGISAIHTGIDPPFLSEDIFSVPARLQLHGGKLYFLSAFNGSPSTAVVWDGAAAASIATAPPTAVIDMVVTTARVFIADSTAIYTSLPGDATMTQFYTKVNDNLHSLATNDTQVFWVTEHAPTIVAACAIGLSCDSPTTVVTVAAGDTAIGVTFDHGMLYTTTLAGDLWGCPPSGCVAQTRPVVRGASFFDGVEWRFGHNVAVDDLAIYYSEKDGMGAHRLMKVAK